MQHILQLPTFAMVIIVDNQIFVDLPAPTNCHCGGRYYVNRHQEKAVRHSILHNKNLYLQIKITSYHCQLCDRYYTNDGNLGIIHSTTALYRQLVLQLAEGTSYGYVAKLLQIPKSTIFGWRKLM